MDTMHKKIIIGGIIATLLFTLAGVFLFSDKIGFNSIQTKWSQEKDYLITEANQDIVITNKSAGFSFKVPENWETESDIYDDSFAFDLIAPNTEIKYDEYGNQLGLLKGCGISVSTITQEDEVGNTKAGIAIASSNPELSISSKLKDEVIEVNNYPALKTTTNPSPEVFQKLGKFIFVKIPISNTTLIDIGMRIMPDSEIECLQTFNQFLINFSIQ